MAVFEYATTIIPILILSVTHYNTLGRKASGIENQISLKTSLPHES